MNKQMSLVVVGLIATVIIGVASGLFLIRLTTPASSNAPKTQLQAEKVQGLSEISSGKLTLVRKSNASVTNSLDFDVVFADDKPADTVLGLTFVLWVSPASLDYANSTITLSPALVKNDFTTPVKTVKKTPSGDRAEISLAAIRLQPVAKILINPGETIASVHLALAKKGTYNISFNNEESKLIVAGNTNVVGSSINSSFDVN